MPRKGVDCSKCGHHFIDTYKLRMHLARKTPCAPVLEKEDLPEEKKDNPYRCKFCGRAFSRPDNLARHLKQACKIVPRDGDTSGMDKLFEHTYQKQMAAMQAKIDALESQVHQKADKPADVRDSSAGALTVASSATGGRRVVADAAPSANTVQGGATANAATGGNANATVNNDNSVGKTVININVFGQENIGRITKSQIIDMFRSLGPQSENLRSQCEAAIIKTAMLIFSDPKHPEDITCYLPNKKGDEALIHGEKGWEVQPIGLVLTPMAARSIDTLFKNQPVPYPDTPVKDVDWMMGECGNIMRYIMHHEGILAGEPSKGEMRGILIRNRELLQQVLAKLPMAGTQ